MTKHNNLIAGLTAALSASAGEEARGMERHLNLLKETPPAPSPEQVLGAAFGKIVEEYMVPSDKLEQTMDRLGRTLIETTTVNILAARKASEAANQGSRNVKEAMSTMADQVSEIHDKVVED
jgi:hypothetical protein